MQKSVKTIVLFFRNWFHVMGGQPAGCCRFDPVCSVYTQQALHRHGVIKGLLVSLRRIVRCGPGGGFGYDPVP